MPIDELARKGSAILMENVVLDTTRGTSLPIPDRLRSREEPGAYLVQSRSALDDAFRAAIAAAGARIVSYVPNNAYLVSGSSAAARKLEANPLAQAVLPYEPYFKLPRRLLRLALSEAPLPKAQTLNVLLFPSDYEQTLAELAGLHVNVLAEHSSPLGPVLRIDPTTSDLVSLAVLPGVQYVELAARRTAANDLSRVLTGVANSSTAAANYLDLTGSNVVVCVNDTGVDPTHPDLAGRVLVDTAASSSDPEGHGTHVAGIIAGNGAQSLSVTSAPSSAMPPVSGQFRGKAPAARIYAIKAVSQDSVIASDEYLQQRAALTNALISNNSWTYTSPQYDLAAASYDAAVRDALPGVSGSQPILFVFPAGNAGQLNSEAGGTSSAIEPGSISSPGTAKNVLTVGATEQPRNITNVVVTTEGGHSVTNAIWLPETDSADQIAGFSSRGNAGVGIEGAAGRFKPDVVAPGSFVLSTRSSTWDSSSYYGKFAPGYEGAKELLQGLNSAAGPYYRYESGTSLSAASVAGVLALMQEFYVQRFGRAPSPALMKALLINGARSLDGYGFQVKNATNHQGWGLVNLTNSLPATLGWSNATPMVFCDQETSNALATGESLTWRISVSEQARLQPLRVTLVWTDPCANPIAAIKLVNDLDLVVTNLSTGEIFYGNDIPAGATSNRPRQATESADMLFDFVNNVENIFLSPPLSSSYSVTINARRVNMNAVTQHDGTVQDYALVIANGNGLLTNALSVDGVPIRRLAAPVVENLTNSFPAGGPDFGSVLLNQRLGGMESLSEGETVPLGGAARLTIGSGAQWHFYTFTNTPGYPHAAFAILPGANIDLALNPLGRDSSARAQPDLDLYVSTNSELTNFSSSAFAEADKSVTRGGAEIVLYDAALPTTYYIGVKCEDRQGADFGLLAVASSEPFSQFDEQGNLLVRGIPNYVPLAEPPESATSNALIVALADQPITIHRVIVTNTVQHPGFSELVGTVSHGGQSVVLNNHSLVDATATATLIYDDSLEKDIAGARRADGPGSLEDFGGYEGFGLWTFQQTSTNTGSPGTEGPLWFLLEPQRDLQSGTTVSLLPGACWHGWLKVPEQSTNLTVAASMRVGVGPVAMELCPPRAEASDCESAILNSTFEQTLTLDSASNPPLAPSVYALKLCNQGIEQTSVSLLAAWQQDIAPPNKRPFAMKSSVPIADNGVTTSSLSVDVTNRITSLKASVRIDHPRVSDLAFWLVSPQNERVLLFENRGGLSTEGLGSDILLTNGTSVSAEGGPQAATNLFDAGKTSGTITINYRMFDKPDELRVYYEGNRIFDSGQVSGSGTYVITYGPGSATTLTIIMNEGGNLDPDTAWDYTAVSTYPGMLYADFVEEDAALPGTVPIKFAVPPFTNAATGPLGGKTIEFLPEEPLERLVGTPAAGQWRLEILDRRAGPNGTGASLLGWQLEFAFEQSNPVPLPLTHGIGMTNTVLPGQIRYYWVDVPVWAKFATNSLFSADVPLNLWFNQTGFPTCTNAADYLLLSNSGAGQVLLSSASTPMLMPGTRYFLAVANTNGAKAHFVLQADFNVPRLTNGQSLAFGISPGASVSVFFADVPTNAASISTELVQLSGNADLILSRKPFPDLSSYDYGSFNPDAENELITVGIDSTPVPLAPGPWYIGIINADLGPVEGTLRYFEQPIETNMLVVLRTEIVGDQICLTWLSRLGFKYSVLGKMELSDLDWAPALTEITGVDGETTACIPLASALNFFKILEQSPLLISSIAVVPDGATLLWSADASLKFQIQWSDNGLDWNTAPGVIFSRTGQFSFFDDGSLTAPLGQYRLYRLLVSP